jgi:hypothetical protein
VLQIVKGAGHMVHHLAARQVAQAVESVVEAPRGCIRDGQAEGSESAGRDVPATV